MSTLLRVLSGIVFVPVLILLSRLGAGWFLLLVNLIVVMACWEFYLVMEAKGVNPSKKVGVTAVLVLVALAYWTGDDHLGLFLAGFAIVITLRELFRAELAFPIYDIATTVFGVIYVGWLGVHLLLLREMPHEFALAYPVGSSILLYCFLMAWSCDTAAYFVGMAMGRHKLFPRVSPAKSVEGAVAGFVAAIAAALVGRVTFVHGSLGEPLLGPWQAAVLGALVGVANQLGDLVESLIKRDARVKDTSAAIPGHGGVLDRFDGLLFSAPITYYFLTFVVFR